MRSILAIVTLVILSVPDMVAAQRHLLITCASEGDRFEIVDGKTSLEVGVDTLNAYLVRELSHDGALSADDEVWVAAVVATARQHATQHAGGDGTVGRETGPRRKSPAARSQTPQLRVEVRRAYYSVERPARPSDAK